jgi:aryl carrier-like protein
MKVVNIAIPPTLRCLTPEELKALAIYAIQGKAGKEVLAEILSERFDTKRKINNIISGIASLDIMALYCDIKEAGVTIDYSRTYFLLTEPYRSNMAIKQM